MNTKKDQPAARRTQAERSEAMRKRLLKATLDSLAEDGYAASTLSSIVRRAGVSRGAQVHHYPSKQALILDAAEDLLRQSYRQLGDIVLSIHDEDDRLQAIVDSIWQNFYATPLFQAFAELLLASHREPQLKDALLNILLRMRGVFEPSVHYYFENQPNTKTDVVGLFAQLCYSMVGLASQLHLMDEPAYIKAQLQLLVQLLHTQMRAKKGVHTAPPRPEQWRVD